MSDDLSFFDRNPDWQVKDELKLLHNRIDSMLTTIANQDSQYNAIWQLYERKYNNILKCEIMTTLLFLFILLVVIFGELFK